MTDSQSQHDPTEILNFLAFFEPCNSYEEDSYKKTV